MGRNLQKQNSTKHIQPVPNCRAKQKIPPSLHSPVVTTKQLRGFGVGQKPQPCNTLMVPHYGRNNIRFGTCVLSLYTFVHSSLRFESRPLITHYPRMEPEQSLLALTVSNFCFLIFLPFLSSLILVFFCFPSYVLHTVSEQIRRDTYEPCLESSDQVASKFSPPTMEFQGLKLGHQVFE